MKVIGSLYLDGQISEASLEGKAPPADSSAQKAMDRDRHASVD